MAYSDDLLSFLGMFVVCVVVVYLGIKMFQMQIHVIEGMTSGSSSTSSGSLVASNGMGVSAESYQSALKAQMVKLQDELLISKYRTEYENVIKK